MKRSLSLLLSCLILITLNATAREDYIIGAYSQYQLHHAHQTAAVFSDLAELLKGAGYNTMLYSTRYEEAVNGRLELALKALNRYGIGSIIDDWAWQTDGPVGVTAMANGNYLKMEAEYKWDHQGSKYNPDTFQNDRSDNDHYNIVFRHETGRRSPHQPERFSNSYAWVCDASEGDKAGVAASEPRFRWKPESRSFSRVLGYDLKFFPDAKDNRLYLKVALNWQDLPLDAKVAQISIKALKNAQMSSRDGVYGVYPEDAYQELELFSSQPDVYSTTIFNQNYSGVDKDPLSGALIFEYWTPIPAPSSKLYTEVMSFDFFNHISPTVHWYGEGRLEIDYLELEDELYRALRQAKHPLQDRLAARLEQIAKVPGSESILFFYGKDEPFQGQFATYARLEDFLKARDRGLITATHLENTFYKKPGGLPDYFHFGLFLQEGKPSVVMLDAYPLQEWGPGPGARIRWNNDFDHELFVQNKIQSVVLANYHKLTSSVKHSADHSNTRLFYVPQSFGEKYEPLETGEWRYFMPPLSMQKCLQLLPLCYAADGVIDFAITSNRDQGFPTGSRAFRRVTPISHKANYLQPGSPDGNSYLRNLAEANAKIAVYGPIIRNLKWLDADSLMVNGSHPKLDIKALNLKSLEVLSPANGPYEGYVQCGYYQDTNGLPAFMLVNRRAVYRSDGDGLVSWDVEKHFVDAEPQTVKLELDPDQFRGNRYGLYDPFLNHLIISDDNTYEIEIAAGDGIMLQLVSLPEDEQKQAPKPARRRSWIKRLFGIK